MHICIAVLAITLPKGGTHLDELFGEVARLSMWPSQA